MKQIIFDCDNTFGVPGCDVDDGLALLYLLGSADAYVHGITAAYGNSSIDVVYPNIKKMLTELGRTDITLKKGGASAGDYDNEASLYLAQMADRYPGQLSILATGSLTNLQGAYEIDKHFFDKIKEIVLMGGITEPLIFEKRVMDELNFSCDPLASLNVLRFGRNVSVITGNNCLKVLFTKSKYKELFSTENKAARYIQESTDYWFQYNEDSYGIHGFYNWDVVAAVYLMHPELFADHRRKFNLSEEDLRTGYLREDTKGTDICNLPVIGKEEPFKENIYHTWMKVKMP